MEHNDRSRHAALPSVPMPAPLRPDNPVPRLRLWSIRRSIALVIMAAVLVIGALIAGALWYAGWPSFRRDGTVTASTLFDLLKLVFSVVAGIGGVAALVVAYRRQRVAEHTNQLAEFAHVLAHAADLRAEIEIDRNGVRLFNERFTTASEQLGSDKGAVRLAGVYAMAGLADDWPEGRQTCIDVLCAYFRMPYTPPTDDLVDSSMPTSGEVSEEHGRPTELARQERAVRHTILRLVVAHLRLPEEASTSWRGMNLDFTGAIFDGAEFSDATFGSGSVSFRNAEFGRVTSFARVQFGAGHVTFEGARLGGHEVTFAEATFGAGTVSFVGTIFDSLVASFTKATFGTGRVKFDEATFRPHRLHFDQVINGSGKLSFNSATFSSANVSFEQAQFGAGRVSFDSASFKDGFISFNMATFGGNEVSFDDATFDAAMLSFERATFSGGMVAFRRATIGGRMVSFRRATFDGAWVIFSRADIVAEKLSFERSAFMSGRLTFLATSFGGTSVSFPHARFGGGCVSFEDAVSQGGRVNFRQAIFGGGKVSLHGAAFDPPPMFDRWADGYLPAGLELPPA